MDTAGKLFWVSTVFSGVVSYFIFRLNRSVRDKRWGATVHFTNRLLLTLFPLVVFLHLSLLLWSERSELFFWIRYVESGVFPVYAFSLIVHVYMNRNYFGSNR